MRALKKRVSRDGIAWIRLLLRQDVKIGRRVLSVARAIPNRLEEPGGEDCANDWAGNIEPAEV